MAGVKNVNLGGGTQPGKGVSFVVQKHKDESYLIRHQNGKTFKLTKNIDEIPKVLKIQEMCTKLEQIHEGGISSDKRKGLEKEVTDFFSKNITLLEKKPKSRDKIDNLTNELHKNKSELTNKVKKVGELTDTQDLVPVSNVSMHDIEQAQEEVKNIRNKINELEKQIDTLKESEKKEILQQLEG